uniref:Uncharacterized protein n=1 Tax=Timema shepardi TaxID=629360 RepID=A0A7R9B0A2_TIMSH|nr:unnamed protein product [Timema shepardi]
MSKRIDYLLLDNWIGRKLEIPTNNPNFYRPHDLIITSYYSFGPYTYEAVKEIMKLSFTDPKIRVSDDVSQLVSEVVSVLAVEATLRACDAASKDGLSTVHLEHVGKILPQLVQERSSPEQWIYTKDGAMKGH